MSERSGLGVIEVALLEAIAAMGARSPARRVRCDRVLAAMERAHGVHPRDGFRVLCDLVSADVVMVPLLDGAGNFGTFGLPAAEPRYTETRLSHAGETALDAERGVLGAVPIGLVNGTMWAGGVRPSFHPGRVSAALLAAGDVNDEELLHIVGPPVFPTGCVVEGDLVALARGERVDLRLLPRVEALEGRIVRITNFPPGIDAAVATTAFFEDLPAIARRRGVMLSASGTGVGWPGPPSFDVTYGPDDELGAVLDALTRLVMLTRVETADLGAPLPAVVRGWLHDHGTERLAERLALLQPDRL